MFLKCRERRKDGKSHRSWSIVESRRYAGRKVAHRHVLCLGEINDSQRTAWERTIAVDGEARQLALFPADRTPPPGEVDTLQVRLRELSLPIRVSGARAGWPAGSGSNCTWTGFSASGWR